MTPNRPERIFLAAATWKRRPLSGNPNTHGFICRIKAQDAEGAEERIRAEMQSRGVSNCVVVIELEASAVTLEVTTKDETWTALEAESNLAPRISSPPVNSPWTRH